MKKLIDHYLADNTIMFFDKLTDRVTISSMNHFQVYFMDDGDRFYDFAEGNLIRTRALNKKVMAKRPTYILPKNLRNC